MLLVFELGLLLLPLLAHEQSMNEVMATAKADEKLLGSVVFRGFKKLSLNWFCCPNWCKNGG